MQLNFIAAQRCWLAALLISASGCGNAQTEQPLETRGASPEPPNPGEHLQQTPEPVAQSTGNVTVVHSEPKVSTLTTRERLRRSQRDVTVETLPDGTPRLNLRGHLHQATLARIGEDGRLETNCVETPEALDRFIGEAEAGDTEQ